MSRGAERDRRLTAEFPPVCGLQFDADNIIWTDGSCLKPDEDGGQQRTGAAYYTAGKTIHVNPNGNDYTNTIQRAELAAIRAALADPIVQEQCRVTVATDSIASLYLIRRAINAPERLHISKHRALLLSIADCRCVMPWKKRMSNGAGLGCTHG